MTQSFASGSNRWITVRKNVVIDADEATHPDHVYRFASPGVPIELRQFNPAKVTSIVGTSVSGTKGDDAVLPGPTIISADCPNCQIYLYADDLDDRIEAYEFLGEATADANGDWTATLSRPLADDEGLRTQSMANANGVIHIFGADTTSKLSDELYLPTPEPPACASYDFNSDGFIDLDDINTVLFNSIFTGAPYDASYDLVPDGVVDIADIFEVALHFGELCP